MSLKHKDLQSTTYCIRDAQVTVKAVQSHISHLISHSKSDSSQFYTKIQIQSKGLNIYLLKCTMYLHYGQLFRTSIQQWYIMAGSAEPWLGSALQAGSKQQVRWDVSAYLVSTHTHTLIISEYTAACFSASLSGSQETHAGLETGFKKEKVQGDIDKRRETEIYNNRWGQKPKGNPTTCLSQTQKCLISSQNIQEWSYFIQKSRGEKETSIFLHKEKTIYCIL